ncbi:glycosyltransferase 87 family protein [Chloroflexota bacterium]
MINSQSLRTGTDFLGFYTAATISQTEGSQSIYNSDLQQQIEERLVGFKLAPDQILLFNHLPYFIPLLSLITTTNYVASFLRWTVILIAFFLLGVQLLLSILSQSGLNKTQKTITMIGTLLFFPVFTSLLNGQDTIFLLLGAALFLVGFISNHPISAGLGLSLMTIRPQLALILAIPFLFYNRKIFFWFIIGSVALGTFVLLYLGLDGSKDFLNILLTSSRGDWYGLHPEDMPTLTGMLQRNFANLTSSAIQIIGMVGYFLAIIGLCITAIKNKTLTINQFGITFLVSIFFAPYLHYHDLSLLLIPIFCLFRVYLPKHRENLILLPITLSIFLLLGFFWSWMRYISVSIAMIAMFYFLLSGEKNMNLESTSQ